MQWYFIINWWYDKSLGFVQCTVLQIKPSIASVSFHVNTTRVFIKWLDQFQHYKCYFLLMEQKTESDNSWFLNILLDVIKWNSNAAYWSFLPHLRFACGWPFLLAFVSFLLWCWFPSTICCFASVYIWKESFCTWKCYTQILALKAGKGGSGNLLVQVKRLNVGNWKHADRHPAVSRSLLGKYKILVYY